VSRPRRQEYVPTAFEGTDAPPGPDLDALAELRRDAGLSDPPRTSPRSPDDVRERTHAPVARERSEPASSRPRSAVSPPSPREPAPSPSTNGEDEGQAPPAKKSERPRADASATSTPKAAKPGRQGRPSKGVRSQRAVRLNPKQETMLLQLADIRGIDLNAAISVAIAEDWRRWFGSRKDTS
jgi:hypothetical protein